MIKIGIDTSTTNTAVVILDGDNKLLNFKLFSPKDKDLIERSHTIVVDVSNYVAEIYEEYEDYDFNIGIEGASFMSVGKRDKLVMLLGAVFYNMRVTYGAITMFPPSTIKKQFTGNGKAKKEEMISNLPKDVASAFASSYKKLDDLADSYAIASIL